MKCKQCRSLVFDFLDEWLSPDDLDRIRLHLTACGGCAKFYLAEQELAGFIHNSPAFKALRYRGPVPSGTAADNLFSAPKRKKSRLWRFPFLKPALLALSLLAAVAVSYIVWFEKPSPSENNSAPGDPEVLADLSDALADPIRDWAERRLIITVTNSRGELDEAIVTSRSPEKIVHIKNEERKK